MAPWARPHLFSYSWGSDNAVPGTSIPRYKSDEDLEADIALAIRLSLQDVKITAVGNGSSPTAGPSTQSNRAIPSSPAEDRIRSPSLLTLVNESGESSSPKPQHERCDDRENSSLQDPHATDPNHYTPWLPRRKNEGILVGLQSAAILTFVFLMFLSIVTFVVLGLNTIFLGENIVKTSHSDQWYPHMVRFFLSCTTSLRGVLNWMPLYMIWRIYSRHPYECSRFKHSSRIAFCAAMFGIMCWVNFSLSSFHDFWNVWSVTNLPSSFQGCQARVSTQQSALFEPGTVKYDNLSHARVDRGTYDAQFDRIWLVAGNSRFSQYEPLNTTLFQSIQNNTSLCSSGFIGNSEIYGIGIRIGLYLQWLAALLANNFLPHNRTELQTVYLVFSLAICLTTIITTFRESCIFGIEIEILYWMYWGGYMCVFGTSPDFIKPGAKSRWVRLDWTTAILFVKHWVMLYHGIWFIWYGYDNYFARMPCGTYQFFIAPVLDPSRSFGKLRDLLMVLSLPVIGSLVLVFPFTAVLLATECRQTVRGSRIFRICFPGNGVVVDQKDSNGKERKKLPIFGRLSRRLSGFYGRIRKAAGLPPYARQGIRLITHRDIQQRRQYRIVCAVMSILSYCLSTSAIEWTLKWNKVTETNNLDATGQYVSLITGAGCLVSVIWRIFEQESKRRSRMRVQQTLERNHETDIVELAPISNRFSDAIQHAFSQGDAEFLSNDGALPTTQSTAYVDDDWRIEEPS